MAIVNNTMIIRRELLTRIAALHKEGKLELDIDKIPFEITRHIIQNHDRCCKHKIRAVAKQKVMALLGYGIENEEDELITLRDYTQMARSQRNEQPKYLIVAEEACSSCVQSNYIVTNLCKGCIAHPCSLNCPKKAVNFNNKGKAEIDSDTCVSCGICKELCPYHAIIYMPVPCEEVCPTGAIKKNAQGKEQIDFNKCVLCGKCVNACPFGSILEHSQLLHLMDDLQNGQKFAAIVAPSVYGQFQASDSEILGAIKALGFAEVIDVAHGATQTAIHETEELKEMANHNQPFLTSSCCPAWVDTVKKHLPEMKPFVSTTPSPMVYAAKYVRENWPDHKVVFIGPCIAKRKEGYENPFVDYVLTFEELGCWFDGWGISPDTDNQLSIAEEIPETSFGFAGTGGVSAAIKSLYPEARTFLFDGIDKKKIKQLKGFATRKTAPAPFLEIMSCTGGCICGPSVHQFPKDAVKAFKTKHTLQTVVP
jgi:[FeFe] hydrogenase (group B1/B3)